ncbi:GNAT family N-acetyltransferase [Dongia sp.]|uniref:GNAT family N-acetyltransferase n=1 Tax=Dongia sp. TaxID=1977262 RepID=UPI0035B4E6CB
MSADSLLSFGRADTADVPQLVNLIHLCFAELAVLTPPSGAAGETLESISALLEKGAIFKALAGDQLVGCVVAEDKGAEIYIGRLAVRPDCRRQGIAGQLLAAAEDYARARGAARLTLNVRLVLSGNIRLFEGAGYRVTGQGSHPGFAVPTFHIMQKDLTFQGWSAVPCLCGSPIV